MAAHGRSHPGPTSLAWVLQNSPSLASFQASKLPSLRSIFAIRLCDPSSTPASALPPYSIPQSPEPALSSQSPSPYASWCHRAESAWLELSSSLVHARPRRPSRRQDLALGIFRTQPLLFASKNLTIRRTSRPRLAVQLRAARHFRSNKDRLHLPATKRFWDTSPSPATTLPPQIPQVPLYHLHAVLAMYSGGYGFGNAAGPSFNNANPQQQQHQQPQQPQQQMMYNQQQQFAGMTPQGAFGPGANPQMMAGGMMQNPGMPHMGANGQSESPSLPAVRVSIAPCTPLCYGLLHSIRVCAPNISSWPAMQPQCVTSHVLTS